MEEIDTYTRRAGPITARLGTVLLCWPTDPAEIARLNQFADGDDFSPTGEHRRTCCDACECEVWIDRQQREQLTSPLARARKLCFRCAFAVQRTVGTLRI